ncbi:hypothetical protein N656DRAFT_548777 [Canariomyces notabilis]|uniref:Uncharacterized protein n=1 Tax=Canariomyces notabilis TaxID=2074819 RepID=A0AAN6TI21_9PEZI|nr:hypothetical protein N656DRAFT_548777 [Canariomyces arenarius]
MEDASRRPPEVKLNGAKESPRGMDYTCRCVVTFAVVHQETISIWAGGLVGEVHRYLGPETAAGGYRRGMLLGLREYGGAEMVLYGATGGASVCRCASLFTFRMLLASMIECTTRTSVHKVTTQCGMERSNKTLNNRTRKPPCRNGDPSM